MSKLTYVNIDELKVGDSVGFCSCPSYGWRSDFRYPVISKRTIKRITPKRTKFVLNDGTELNDREAKQLVILNEEAQRQSNVAKTFSDLKYILYKIEESNRKGIYLVEKKLSDKELIEYHKFMKSLYDKYMGGN